MLSTISKALENFCIHQLGTQCTIDDGVSKKRTLIAYIDIDTKSNQNYRVYIASDKNFIQRVSQLFLEEDESDEETLIDMALETTNLVVGSAKVIAEELDIDSYTIQTPHFLEVGIFNLEYDQAKIFTIESDEASIAIKELS